MSTFYCRIEDKTNGRKTYFVHKFKIICKINTKNKTNSSWRSSRSIFVLLVIFLCTNCCLSSDFYSDSICARSCD